MMHLLNFDSFNESAENDIKNNNIGKKIYKKIVDGIRSIQLIPTDANDIITSNKNRIIPLKGVKFNLNLIDKKYNINIYIVEMLNYYSKEMFFDKNNNRLVFRILSKDYENYEKMAKYVSKQQ